MGNTESIAADEQQPTESELTQSQRQRSGSHRHRRRQRRITLETSTAPPELYNDCPWWSKIENESLILDYAPNITFEVNENESVTAKATLSHDELEELIRKYETVKVTTTPRSESRAESEPKETVAASPVANSPKPSKEPTPAREQSLEEFKEELRVKRLARQTAVQDLRDEISTLRQQLAQEQSLTKQLRSSDCSVENAAIEPKASSPCNEPQAAGIKQPEVDDGAAGVDADDEDPLSRSRHANIALANVQLALQLSQAENLSLRSELDVVQKQVGTLKEVIACCKQMLAVKEEQCTQLKTKLQEIEISFGEREMKIMSNNLREEYERQLLNIRQLRQLYEERQRIAAAEQENLQRLVAIKRDELQQEQEKTKNLEECNQTLVKEVENVNNELAAIRDECNEHKFEKRALKEELGAINTLFTQMVLGFNGKNNLDIDRLTAMLEENRTLLNEMTTKEMNCSDGATLPKLLFELVEQAAVVDDATTSEEKDDDKRCTAPMSLDEENAAKEAIDEVDEIRVAADADITRNVNDAGDEQTNADECMSADNESGIEKANAATQLVLNKRQTTKRSSHATSKSKAMLKFPEAEAMMLMGVSCSNADSDANATAAAAGGGGGNKVVSAQEIIGNLPKVWRVLMELLSHHKIEQVQFEENGMSEDCYKSVETPNGPKAELSVSKTYIKLKDLILEKKSLMKETNRLKTLNSHLDYRLNEQEKRLSAVSLELTKTWHLVGKMQRQHRQLHTQEQILRYQLQQKRRLLSELREELEYCRRKWAAARARNDESQEQWNDLRREFAQRKLDDANHSAESGYSDSGPASDEEAGAGVAAVAAGAVAVANDDVAQQSACSRRKHLKEMFEHTRKIKRMQSTSPGRAAGTQPVAATTSAGEADNEEIVVLRWNSAPPTCGWRSIDNDELDDDDDTDFDDDDDDAEGNAATVADKRGAIPKAVPHNSRSKQRRRTATVAKDIDIVLGDVASTPPTERASRIQRLEEQCKSLIQKVLETSDNRERLEVQLCEFQEAVSPVQYAVPLEEFTGNRKRLERMTRASSAPVRGTLTPREEEYTRKRSERLERLEEESRQLMSRIKRTSDRGHYLRCSLDRIRRATPRDDSCDSNTEDELPRVEEVAVVDAASPLTAEEEAYTARRTARLQRLEAESQALLSTLTRQTERGGSMEQKLEQLHDRYASNESPTRKATSAEQPSETIEKRLENIEQISLNRDERLRLLEAEGKALLTRLTNTSERGTQIINRIAERELSREQRRASSTPKKDDAETLDVAAAELMPTANNVASSSIVDEELSEAVVVTTTSTQIGAQQGAIPKQSANKVTPPPTELSKFARAKTIKKQEKPADSQQQAETLEDMVKRLQQLPFPTEENANNIEASSSKNPQELNENQQPDAAD